MDQFIAKIIAQLDTSDFDTKMNSLLSKTRKLDIELNIANQNGNLFDDLEKAAQKSSVRIGNQFASGLKSIKFTGDPIDFAKARSDANKEIDKLVSDMKKKLSGTDSEMSDKDYTSAAKKYVSEMANAEKKVLADRDKIAKIQQKRDYENYIEQGKQYRKYQEELLKASEIQSKIKTKDYDAKISNFKTSLGKNSDTAENFKQTEAAIKGVEQAYVELKVASDAVSKDASKENIAQQAESYKKLTDSIKLAENEMKILGNEQSKAVNPTRLNASVNSFEQFFSKNTKAAKVLKEEVEELGKAFANVKVEKDLDIANNQFRDLKTKIIQEGLMGKDWIGQVKDTFSKFGASFSVAGLIMAAVSQFKQMAQSVYEIDTAMTNLYKVTDETDAKYQKFLKNSGKGAQELGRSMSSYITQVSEWAKLGYGIDLSEDLAKVSSIYANVGEVDDATSVSDIVSTIKAFGIEAENSIEVVDKLNKLGKQDAQAA